MSTPPLTTEQAIEQIEREALRDGVVLFLAGLAAGALLFRFADVIAAVLRAIATA